MTIHTPTLLIAFASLALVCIPRGVAMADTISVSNNTSVVSNTSVSASSGGNSSSSEGEGKSTVSLESYTIINGQNVESFSKKIESTGHEPVTIRHESSYATSSVSASSSLNAEVHTSAPAVLEHAKAMMKKTASTTAPMKKSMWRIIPWGNASTSAVHTSSSETASSSAIRSSFTSSMWHRTTSLFRTIFSY